MTNKKILRLQKKIGELYLKIAEEREKCEHKNLTIKYGADTGNWCRSDDTYWLDVKCDDCGQTFHYTSDKPEYREIGLAKYDPQKYGKTSVKEVD